MEKRLVSVRKDKVGWLISSDKRDSHRKTIQGKFPKAEQFFKLILGVTLEVTHYMSPHGTMSLQMWQLSSSCKSQQRIQETVVDAERAL